MKNIACHISKQRMWQPSSHHITAAPRGRALRRLRMRKHRILAPDSWGAYQRNDFSEPRLLHLPIHSKVLNSLTWDIWFSLINSNLLIFWFSGLCCKNSYISCLPSSLFGAVLQSYLRCCVPGSSPLFCQQIKHNS